MYSKGSRADVGADVGRIPGRRGCRRGCSLIFSKAGVGASGALLGIAMVKRTSNKSFDGMAEGHPALLHANYKFSRRAVFLESIFIDQGSLNGNRPSHPQMPTRPDLPTI